MLRIFVVILLLPFCATSLLSGEPANVSFSPRVTSGCFTPYDGKSYSPKVVFEGREPQHFHFFLPSSGREVWAFLTGPIVSCINSPNRNLHGNLETADLGLAYLASFRVATGRVYEEPNFSPFAVVIFDDYSVAAFDSSENGMGRITYKQKTYYIKMKYFQIPAPPGNMIPAWEKSLETSEE